MLAAVAQTGVTSKFAERQIVDDRVLITLPTKAKSFRL